MTPDDLVLTRMGVRFGGRVFPCTIGRGGISGNKCEGDGATPVGAHLITGGLYRVDRMRPLATALPLVALGHNDIWSDDPADPGYNQHLCRRNHPFRHENLWRSDPLYDLVLTTEWNQNPTHPGRGSAIFIHRWRRPGYPTEGCVALAPDVLRHLVARLRPGARLIVPEGLCSE